MILKKIILAACSLYFYSTFAQEEFNAVVTVNSDKIQNTNRKIYQTLENSIREFINQTKWTDKKYKPHERINCAFTITLNEQNQNEFKGSLQIQVMRPVYGTNYETPILNINDKEFSFNYIEYQPFNFNENSSNNNNLVSSLVFYVYTILGIDADTFTLNAGSDYYKKAMNIVRLAQQSGGATWQNKIGEANKYALIDGFTSSKLKAIRDVYYNYHRKGLDSFETNEIEAKKTIATSLMSLEKIHNATVGNYLLRVFIDSKGNEIVNIFSEGKECGMEDKLKRVLKRIAATQSNKWKKIK